MPLVRAYVGSVNVTGASNWHTEPFYRTSKRIFGETKGTFLDNLVEVAVEVAKESYQWKVKNKPSAYLPADEYWTVSFSTPGDFKPRPDRPFMFFSQIAMAAVRLRDSSVLEIATEIAQRNRKPVSEIEPLPVKDFDDNFFPPSELEEFPDESYFSEMALYGNSGAQLDEMLDLAQRKGYLNPAKRLRLQWK